MQRQTDSGLLAKAIGVMNRQFGRIKTVGAAARTPWRDRTRAAGRRARQINSRLRLRQAQNREENQVAVLRITGELADVAVQAARDAAPVLRIARRALAKAAGRRAAVRGHCGRDAAGIDGHEADRSPAFHQDVPLVLPSAKVPVNDP